MQPPTPVPDLDWEPKRAREFGEAALDIWEEFLTRLRTLPVSRGRPDAEVRAAVVRQIPREPVPLDELASSLRDLVLEHSMYPGHPAFMAYITGAGTVPGAAADLLASALNQNLGVARLSPAASAIETDLAHWFATRFDMPSETSGGIFSSGGAMANFIALKAARDAKAGSDVRVSGVSAGPPLVLYASDEVHGVVDRAADMLGLGSNAVRHVASGDDFRLDTIALRDAIARDLADGRRPIAVVGTAGTVATGAVDPLGDIAGVCEEFGLWFHVDGAYGGPAAFTPGLKHLFEGIERADSIVFDPHKWLYTPHSGGCTVFRDLSQLHDAFSISAAYVHEDKERAGHGIDLYEMGPQFSRGFYGLKIWVSLLAHGLDAYERRIEHDAALARYLHARATERPDFEPFADPVLSIACFRYVPPGTAPGNDAYLDALNERIMTELQLDGRVFCSNAVLHGRFVLRACIVNFRTEAADCDLLLDVAAEIGARLDAEMRPS